MPAPNGTYLTLSLRGATRRGNLQMLDLKQKDCFASLAMTIAWGSTKCHSGLRPVFDEMIRSCKIPVLLLR